ncbi:MAG: antitoxin family protein [bacterium]|nr:antitoxin family protein [bacterium]
MKTRLTATYANGVLAPVEPLDLVEGAQVTVSIDDAPAAKSAQSSQVGGESLLEMFDRLQESVPPAAWKEMPADGAQNYKHYLYGRPRVQEQ